MKIVTWNCNGSLRTKTKFADNLNADILVIQECEDPSRSTSAYKEWAGDYLWVGDSKNKGIGVFSKNGHLIEALDWKGAFKIEIPNHSSQSLEWKTTDLKLFLPFRVNHKLTVLAVWTKGVNDGVFGYIGQLWKYLQVHQQELQSNTSTVILGDFNSNAIWDKPDRWWNHSDVIDQLSSIGLKSLYHHFYSERQGKESKPTFFLHKKASKNYHIDYLFCSEDLLNKSSLEVGKYEDWINVSDHIPLRANLEFK